MSAEKQLRAIAPIKAKCDLTLPPDWLEIPEQLLYLTSLDPVDMKGKLAIVACIDGDCVPAADRVNLYIDVQDVFVHVVKLENDETGEIARCFRTVMVEPDGTRVAAVSDGVLKSLQILASVMGPFPWKPAVKLKLQRIQTSGNRSRYRLIMPAGADAVPE